MPRARTYECCREIRTQLLYTPVHVGQVVEGFNTHTNRTDRVRVVALHPRDPNLHQVEYLDPGLTMDFTQLGPTYTTLVTGQEVVEALTYRLIQESQFFSVMPHPDDTWLVTVRHENRERLRTWIEEAQVVAHELQHG